MKKNHMGRFWEIDQNGLILNDSSPTYLTKQWWSLISDFLSFLETQRMLLNLEGVYLSGSVSRGLVIPWVSDFDIIFVTNCTEIDPVPIFDSFYPTLAKYGLTRVCYKSASPDEVTRTNFFSQAAFLISTQSINIWGADYSSQIRKFPLGKAVMNNDIVKLKRRVEICIEDFERNQCKLNLEFWFPIMIKELLRTGFLICSQKHKKYTRDIPLCCEVLINDYPEQKQNVRLAQKMYITKEFDHHIALSFLYDFGNWLVGEAELWLDVNNPWRLNNLSVDMDYLEGSK
ncbi:MAG: hypothetical protein H6657_29440 [Ardenticatenaceae bacterium]|nr:hypothetical protein [Ardenticatenaceae bacterium]